MTPSSSQWFHHPLCLGFLSGDIDGDGEEWENSLEEALQDHAAMRASEVTPWATLQRHWVALILGLCAQIATANPRQGQVGTGCWMVPVLALGLAQMLQRVVE
jgi:hypothetical protein